MFVSQTFSVFRLTLGISKSANFNYTAILWLQKVQMDAKVGHQEGSRQGRGERGRFRLFRTKLENHLPINSPINSMSNFLYFLCRGANWSFVGDGSTTSSNNKTVSSALRFFGQRPLTNAITSRWTTSHWWLSSTLANKLSYYHYRHYFVRFSAN